MSERYLRGRKTEFQRRSKDFFLTYLSVDEERTDLHIDIF